ncbi:ABC-three component system protein [Kitasatospora purpeofusca]|uniref:ABC-three component system protein n=1 Tax=Kitasatospora purpeofusca TaxID=67352 RepID=UPI002A5AABF9|nr:ABC-three component system protein [Kitasatospora purpeofusca]MDY0816242.1 ABC-three component system protein [Kitasatospora purpeofusca]
MRFEQRMYARVKFLELMADLYESAFEDFFHRVMVTRYPNFLDVRTHGRLGDQGADGLTLSSRKLYACYAPQTVDASAVRTKFTKDLASAIRQRNGQFDTFVFVHNDRRGVHPEITTMLSVADTNHPDLAFEQMGTRSIWQECMSLELEQAEDVLSCEIPVKPTVYGVGMDDLKPLLQHLKELRTEADPLMDLPQVHEEKLAFNLLQGDSREDLLRGMRHTHLVEAFYAGGIRALEQDEVARGFRIFYEQVREQYPDPDDVLWQLEMYVLGNERQRRSVHRAAWVVLAHFFFRCDIFEAPPSDWAAAPFVGVQP